MTAQELLTALLGSLGCLVLSLLLNYLFYKGAITNPTKTVPRADYEISMDISKRNTEALELIAKRRRRDEDDARRE
jgi:hypothetical protein